MIYIDPPRGHRLPVPGNLQYVLNRTQDVVYVQTADADESLEDGFGRRRKPPSPEKPFWNPLKLIAATIAAIAAVAGLISNVESILDFLQPSVSGQWMLTQTVGTSNATFVLNLDQHGHKLTGDAIQIQVDGQAIPPARQNEMKLRGQISGTDVMLEYTEKPAHQGSGHETLGELSLNVIRPGVLTRRISRMEGTFSATEASTSGKSVAVPKL
jgi:hypothetical protein